MRILYLIHQFLPEFSGGTEQVALNLAKAAQGVGHQVEVLTVANSKFAWRLPAGVEGGAIINGIPVTALIGVTGDPIVELGFRQNAVLREKIEAFLAAREPFDVAHVFHAFRTVDIVEVLIERSVPFIVTFTDFFNLCHRINFVRKNGDICSGPSGGKNCQTFCAESELGHEAYSDRLKRLRACLEKSLALVAVSEFVAKAFRAEYPEFEIKVIPNGVDLLRFEVKPPTITPKPSITFGYMGTISEAKGVIVLAQAFAMASPPNAKLRLVGPCYDETVRAEILSCGADLEISLEGPVEAVAVPGILAQFDILCVPSQWPETFSLALHEGFAAGLPALVSDLGNLADVVNRHRCGQVIAAADTKIWAGIINSISINRTIIDSWTRNIPLPFRVEEEGFIYVQLYTAAKASRSARVNSEIQDSAGRPG